MLVLGRQVDQRVVISVPGREPIRVMIVDVRHRQARLGFEADDDIVIDREEIYLAKKEQERE